MPRVLPVVLLLAPLSAQVCEVDITPRGGLASGEHFGWSVAIDGERALVGYPSDAEVVVFERTGGIWIETARLSPSYPGAGRFGTDVDLEGGRAVVGAPLTSYSGIIHVGMAFVYELRAGAWVETALLTPEVLRPHAAFGSAIGVEGDLLVIGADGDEFQDGGVYFFERAGTSWVQVARRLASVQTGHFGSTLDVQGGRAIVGARGGGGAFVFENHGGWVETARLLPSGVTGTCPACGYGRSVALHDGFAVVGAPYHGDSASGQGAVCVFERVLVGWVYAGLVLDPDPETEDQFGASVAMHGDRLAVGVLQDGSTASSIPGAVALFERQGGAFVFERKLRAAAAAPYHGLGFSVDLSDERVIAGASLSGQSYFSGGAHVYDPAGPLGTPYCSVTPNSSGAPAALSAGGCPHVADNALTLTATEVPANVFGYFLTAHQQAFVPLFGGGSGNLCLGLPIVRFSGDVLNSGAAGTMTLALDLDALPQGTVVQPGDTWSFQLWFRDVGNTSNTSNGLAVTFATHSEPAVQFPVTAFDIVEQTTQIEILVTLSQPAAEDVLVAYSESGTATVNVDYRIESLNPFVIPAGTVEYGLPVTIAADLDVEADETVVIDLAPASGGVPGTATRHTLTIVDDD